jgi:predicted transcriptional regulator of viral defense system
MKNKDRILEFVKKNNGMITSKNVVDMQISKGSLKHLVDKGSLEKASRGVYILPDVWEDEFYNIQARFHRGIYSRETALFLLGYTDRTPNKFHMSFPNNYNTSSAKKENIICDRIKLEVYDLGIIDIKTPNGNFVKTYRIEKNIM